MQWLYIMLLCCFSFAPVFRAEPDLPVNSAGKVAFEGFVSVPEADKNLMLRNALSYMERVQKLSDKAARPQLQLAEGLLSKQGSFMVYKEGMLSTQPHGEIQYVVTLKVTDGGYTYHYTDFVFQYYQRNRYGLYEPQHGRKKALEVQKFAGMQELWEAHKKATRKHIENHIITLQAVMAQEPGGAQRGSNIEEMQHH